MSENESSFPPDPLDAVLRRSLQARPDPSPVAALADRAMRLAHSSDRAADALARFKRVRRWIGLLTAVAIVLVAVVLYFGGERTAELAPLSFSSDSTSTDTASDTTSAQSTVSAASSSQTSESQRTALLLAGIVCGAILLLTLRRVFEPDPRYLDTWQLPRAC